MAAFDPTHIFDLAYLPIKITYAYSVTITPYQSGYEDRNLENAKRKRLISLNWSGDSGIADLELTEFVATAYDRAKGPHEGFYLDHRFFNKLIPVRWNSELNIELLGAAGCCDDWAIAIQELTLIEVFDAPPIDRS